MDINNIKDIEIRQKVITNAQNIKDGNLSNNFGYHINVFNSYGNRNGKIEGVISKHDIRLIKLEGVFSHNGFRLIQLEGTIDLH